MYHKLAFGAGYILPLMTLAMWYTYAVAFFEKVLELPSKSVGTVILVGHIVGSVFAPFVGIWSDQSSSRYGKRKMTYLVAATAMVLSFFFIWHNCITCADTPPPYQMIYFGSFSAIFLCGSAATQLSLTAMIPEIAPNENVSMELSVIWYVM